MLRWLLDVFELKDIAWVALIAAAIGVGSYLLGMMKFWLFM